MQIGKASFSNNTQYKKTEIFKLGDGEFVCAILPPVGSLAKSGKWSQHYAVHFGYKNSEGKMKVFQSSLVKNKDRMVTTPDPALDRINSLKAQLEQAKKDGNIDLMKRLEEFVGMKGQFNLDSNHHLNAITLDGKIGVLKLRHRAKMALDETIKVLLGKGIDPFSRYFSFRRSGRGLDTTFQVNVYQKTINVPGIGDVQQDVTFTLSPDILARIATEARDLSDMYPKLTAEEIGRIVKEGPKAVDEIFNSKKKSASSSEEMSEESPETEDSSANANMVSAPTTVAQAPVVNETKAALAQQTPVSTPVATAVSALSQADFLASLNV